MECENSLAMQMLDNTLTHSGGQQTGGVIGQMDRPPIDKLGVMRKECAFFCLGGEPRRTLPFLWVTSGAQASACLA